ncbi:hypothetical protein PMIN06_007552 [Paraphaeosphaeria minitans]|uniref:Uncharacterized protein n=1 Tax=Paraphaeosphaeria minitans TaxID=565426 RepID=A0A9P6GD13_9PLEO|nr:hypothetical protein PMIN01_09114 [Paraphaeosphaeria minitans]
MALINQNNETFLMDKDRYELTETPTANLADIASDMSASDWEHEAAGLFKLSAELRNKIYKYDLNSDNRLLSCVIKPKPVRYPKVTEYKLRARLRRTVTNLAFNQLQFVNRQLCHETAALELKLNVIHFPDDIDDQGTKNPLQIVHEFRAASSPRKSSWLSGIRVRS